MKVGENGQLENPGLSISGFTNEQIVFLYVSTRGAYLHKKEEFEKRIKQAKGLQAMLSAMDDEDHPVAKELKAKMESMIGDAGEAEKVFPEDKYIVGITQNLKPLFFAIKDADEDMVKGIVEECFRSEIKVIQKILNETEEEV